MNGLRLQRLLSISTIILPASAGAVMPVSSAFTYQGQLKEGGVPLNAFCDIYFSLWNDPVETDPGLGQVGTTQAFDDTTGFTVLVENGLFQVQVDFGPEAFDGTARWLEIAIECPSAPGDTDLVMLAPRQEITVAPYAQTALNTVGVDGHSLDAMDAGPADAVFVDNAGRVGIGTGTPEARLHVSDGGSGDLLLNAGDQLLVNPVLDFVGVGRSTRVTSAERFGIFAPTTGFGGMYVQTEAGGGPFYGYSSGGTADAYHWYTSDRNAWELWIDAPRLVVDGDTGNVGIGTTNPQRRLHVANGAAGLAPLGNAQLVVERDANAYINLLTPDDSESGLLFGKPTGGAAAGGLVYNANDNPDGFQFRTNGNLTRMVVGSNGDVGIGTIDPAVRLHVRDGSPGTPSPNSNASLALERSANNYINMLAPDGSESGILFGKPTGGTAVGGILFNSATTPDGLEIRTDGDNTRMVIDATGQIGIGTNSPTNRLTAVGSAQNAVIRAENSANGEGAVGIHGVLSAANQQSNSAAVRGESRATNLYGIGVWGSHEGDGVGVQGTTLNNTGVFGVASAATGIAVGVIGDSHSDEGVGVRGNALATSGANIGVWGRTDSPDGYAGYFEGGRNYFDGHVGIGASNPAHPLTVVGGSEVVLHVENNTTQAGGKGIHCVLDAPSQENDTAAIHGDNQVLGLGQIGVLGTHFDSGWGVMGETVRGRGVFGHATSTTQQNYGVYGGTDSSHHLARGVFGVAASGSGLAHAVHGSTFSATGYAGYFEGGRNYFEGNVGIGNTEPQAPLHVREGDPDGPAPHGNASLALERNGNNYLNMIAPDDSESAILFGKPTGGNAVAGVFFNSGNLPEGLQFRTGGNLARMVIEDNGNVGIGLTNPNFKLHLSSNSAAKPTSNTWTVFSDRRLKKNIKPIRGALSDLLSLRGVTYQWRDSQTQGDMDGTYTGLIAQDVEKVFPDWVGEDENGYKTLTVIGFEAIVVEAIREVRNESRDAITTLREENARLKKRLAKLEAIVLASKDENSH